MLGVQHARASGRRTRDLDRRLDGLGAGVGGDHRRDAVRRTRQQRLGQDPAEQRHAELWQVAGARGHHLLNGLDRLRMVAPDRKHAVAAEQVQVALAVGVDQVCALAAAPHLVEAQRA